jgi:hypothetical protein
LLAVAERSARRFAGSNGDCASAAAGRSNASARDRGPPDASRRESPERPRNATAAETILPAAAGSGTAALHARGASQPARGLDGLGKILDAGALEELFTGPDEEALFLYDLLAGCHARARVAYYWEICRTRAARRGVPEYVVDRAAVLHSTMVERRRTDLYRILGVPPLSSNETIRRRWLEIAKLHHPTSAATAPVFRQARQAYDVLSDATAAATTSASGSAPSALRARRAVDRELPPPSRWW